LEASEEGQIEIEIEMEKGAGRPPAAPSISISISICPLLPSPVRLAINFQGRVQGVGFRFTAREIVTRHPAPLTGWVRNEQDGSVQMEIQGEPAAIETALTELQSAMSSNIKTTSRTEIPEVYNERMFSIDH
jgi:acylphosphatase